ncbi:MAG TPA: glycoside hydrolase family 5 protein [Pyrinomonadaceae bacterium]|nr:glycoside hydrolase family 5 protein [Pyrinomonadaceae bacterium]
MSLSRDGRAFVLLLTLALTFARAFDVCAQTRAKAVRAKPRGGFVSVRGKELIGPDGRPLALKGIGLGNWLLPEGYMLKLKATSSPRLIETALNQLVGEAEARRFWREFRERYVTARDIALIKRSGFNSVRVAFSYRLFVTETDPPRLEGPGYELLDRVVEWCGREGLYVVLDMHAAPGGQTGDNIDDSFGYPFLFESEESQELTVRLWQKLAARYKNERAVAGYDLLNEPIPHFFDAAYFNPKLEPLYKRIVAAVREVDRDHVIFLGGAQWNTNFKVFGPPFDAKLAYTFHKYWFDVKQEAVEEYVAFRERYGVPVWLGESGENTDEWVASFRSLLEKNDIGWCFWPYKKMESTSGVVSVGKPEGWDAIVAFADGPRATFEEVRKNRPPRDVVKKALDGYLENIRVENCKVNEGYLKALGLK